MHLLAQGDPVNTNHIGLAISLVNSVVIIGLTVLGLVLRKGGDARAPQQSDGCRYEHEAMVNQLNRIDMQNQAILQTQNKMCGVLDGVGKVLDRINDRLEDDHPRRHTEDS